MLNIKRIFIGIVLCNSLLFGAHNGIVVQVPQQPVTAMGRLNSTIAIFSYVGKEQPSPQQKNVQAHVNGVSEQIKILENAAQKKIDLIEQKTKPMSDYIDHKYIGEGDNWSFMNLLITRMGFSDSFHSVSSAITTLADIHGYFKRSDWNHDAIWSLYCSDSRAHNGRLYNLLSGLLIVKRNRYHLIPRHQQECAYIKGSTIDEFFDEEFLYPGLPRPFQKFLQHLAEEEFRLGCVLLDKPEFKSKSTKFLILLAVLHNSEGHSQELKALFTSKALREHEKNTDFAFTQYIRESKKENNFWCKWFPWSCGK